MSKKRRVVRAELELGGSSFSRIYYVGVWFTVAGDLTEGWIRTRAK